MLSSNVPADPNPSVPAATAAGDSITATKSANTRLSQPIQPTEAEAEGVTTLLSLPDDLLGTICSRQYLPPTTLVDFACASKAAASVSLPILYSRLLIPTFSALPLLYTTLRARPELAQHVQSIVASRYFAMDDRVADVYSQLEAARLHMDSFIISPKRAHKLCDPELLANLPQAWFVRIAQLCPKLSIVDLSKAPFDPQYSSFLLFGLHDLAAILRERRGKFVTTRFLPFSCVLVNDQVMDPICHDKYQLDFYFATEMDWATKSMVVSNYKAQGMAPSLFCIIPFRDLTSSSALPGTEQEQQAQWTIRNALVQARTPGRAPLVSWNAASLVASPEKLWTVAGIEMGRDRIFDFSKPNQIRGKVQLTVDHVLMIYRSFTQLHISNDQCDELLFDTVPKEELMADHSLQLYTATFEHFQAMFPMLLNAPPLVGVTQLTVKCAFILQHTITPTVMHAIAESMPNLVELRLNDLRFWSIESVMLSIDMLLRRKNGRPLQLLNVDAWLFNIPSARRTDQERDPMVDMERTRLDCTRATPGHLRVFSLSISGPGVQQGLALEHVQSFVMHPGLLHGIEELQLNHVQLYVVPPHLAQPESPSMYPLLFYPKANSILESTLVPLHHLTLPRMSNLVLTSDAIIAGFSHGILHRGARSTSLLLPKCRNMAVLGLLLNIRQASLSLANLMTVLEMHPNVDMVHIVGVMAGKDQIDALAHKVLRAYPRVVCPRLRRLTVNDQTYLGDFRGRYQPGSVCERLESGMGVREAVSTAEEEVGQVSELCVDAE